MTENGWLLLEMLGNSRQLFEMAESGFKKTMIDMAENVWKWLDWLETAGNSLALLEKA